jgi:hypothetical protein
MSTNNQNKFTFYIDVSGSVGRFYDYWNHVEQIYNKYNKTNQVGRIFIWDSAIQEVNQDKLEELIKSKYGGGGTEPNYIAKSLIDNQINSNIIIFTDGDVSDYSVTTCDKTLESYPIENVQCYIIGNSNANLSVTSVSYTHLRAHETG